MERQNANKLKELLDETPHGFLVDANALARSGIDHRLVHKYLKSGWLEPVIRGVYRRPFLGVSGPADQATEWQIVMLSLSLMGYQGHVGGETALGLQGYRHNLRLAGKERVFVFGDDLPNWLRRVRTNADFLTRNLSLFDGADLCVGARESGFAEHPTRDTAALNTLHLTMRLSYPERAVLEMLNEVPGEMTFASVDQIFEGLANLRPARLQSLLDACTSIKTKRLFFVFADRHNHAWRKYVSPEGFDLGKGPRTLFKGGKYHPEYRISVPADFVEKFERADDR